MHWIEDYRSPWKLSDAIVDAGVAPYDIMPTCTLDETVRAMCNCVWHRYAAVEVDQSRIQHGENSEHSLVFADIDSKVICSRGHTHELCSWAAAIVKRAHSEVLA